MGASLALAGVSACTRQPDEAIVPYVRQPEELVPGKPLFYATAMPFAGSGVGLLVESHEGRPTKIEGNPDHPSSRGATDLFAQAAILGLYDPDRSQTITHLGEIRPFDAFVAAVRGVLAAQQATRRRRASASSPRRSRRRRWPRRSTSSSARFPQAKWVQWEPFGRHNAREGSRLAFGEYVDAQYAIDRADVILSLDADFLCAGDGGLKHARAFASRRRIEGDRAAAQPALRRREHADQHRHQGRSPPAAARLGHRGVRPRGGGAARRGRRRRRRPCRSRREAGSDRSSKDLQAARGRSLVIAGDGQPPAVHALAHAMNDALGNVGATVTYTQTAEARR